MIEIVVGNALDALKECSDEMFDCIVTSPPYFGLRAYKGEPGMIGLEDTLEEYVENLVTVFREARRTLRKDGTLWLNLGDAYWRGKGITGGANAAQMEKRKSKTLNSAGQHVDMGGRMLPTDGKHETIKPKDLILMPFEVAKALRDDGWYLRSEIVWHKPNPMPEPVKDRPTGAHEKIFLFSKHKNYYYNAEAVKTEMSGDSLARLGRHPSQGRRVNDDAGVPETGLPEYYEAYQNSDEKPDMKANLRNVWSVSVKGFKGAHFATFPPDLIEPCIKAGSRKNGIVLDPFAGSGTTGLVADRLGHSAMLIEISREYAEMAQKRINDDAPLFAEVDFNAV